MKWTIVLCLSLLAPAAFPAPASSQDSTPTYRIDTLVPAYLPVDTMLELLGAGAEGNVRVLSWQAADGGHRVEIRPQETANRLILSGTPADIAVARNLAAAVDLPPRQIEISAQILEVNRDKASDLGIDWQGLWETSNTTGTWRYGENSYDQTIRNGSANVNVGADRVSRDLNITSYARVSNFVKLLQENGAGRMRNAPRILTLNNRAATIMDGQRVTYVTRASSYSNIYETQTMDAGLKLDVVPTLGESGYLTLDIKAELTSLTGGNVSGSPVKDGQIIENTVIVKDGDTVLLGGFQRNVEQHATKRFPVLGWVLPFIFSREVRTEQTLDSYIVLTARVVDLNPTLDENVLKLIQGW